MGAALSRRVARALYATPNALDTDLLRLVSQSTDAAETFDELPEKVRKIVLWVEQYIGGPDTPEPDESEVEEAEDGPA